jgi:hypothetical protein
MDYTDYTGLPDHNWIVNSVDPNDPAGMKASDVLVFGPNGQDMVITRLLIDGAQAVGSELWGACSWAQSGDVQGSTADGRGFLIEYDAGEPPRLVCRLTNPPARRRSPFAAGLSALGTLIGAAVGASRRVPVAGTLPGRGSSVVGSAGASGDGHHFGWKTGPNGTWVAEDGGSGNVRGPHSSTSNSQN